MAANQVDGREGKHWGHINMRIKDFWGDLDFEQTKVIIVSQAPNPDTLRLFLLVFMLSSTKQLLFIGHQNIYTHIQCHRHSVVKERE